MQSWIHMHDSKYRLMIKKIRFVSKLINRFIVFLYQQDIIKLIIGCHEIYITFAITCARYFSLIILLNNNKITFV